MPKIGALKRNKLKRLFRFGFYTSLLFSAIFYIDTNDFYLEQVINGFFFGVLVGILEEMTSHRRYTNISLTLQFLIKIFGIVLIVIFMMVMLVVMHPGIEFENVKEFLQQKEVSSPLILSLIVAFTISISL